MKDNLSKTKGLAITKIIWTLAALIFALLTYARFTAIGSLAEDTMDCIKEGFKYFNYFLAYILGTIYLFNRKWEKFVVIGAFIYAVAYSFSIIVDLTNGSSFALYHITCRLLTLVAYVVFAIFIRILVKGKPLDLYTKSLKYWYIPTVLLFVVRLIADLWVELVRPDGFLLDGFIFDIVADIIAIFPIYLMSKVVKGWKEIKQVPIS